jgi:hypothetical protein
VSYPPGPPLAALDLSAALEHLDRPDRVRWQAAALLAYRRPPGAERLVADLSGASWVTRGARLLARLSLLPARRRAVLST